MKGVLVGFVGGASNRISFFHLKSTADAVKRTHLSRRSRFHVAIQYFRQRTGMRSKAYKYIPSQERLSNEKRSAIARNAALARARQRRETPGICECGHSESEHWSVGSRECWRCYEQDDVEPCSGFTPRTAHR